MEQLSGPSWLLIMNYSGSFDRCEQGSGEWGWLVNEYGEPLLGLSSAWKRDDKGEEQEGSDTKGSLYSFLLLVGN